MTHALRTLHISCDEIPYVELELGLEYRLLHARPEEGLIATQVRAQPGAISGLHRHLAPVFGYTTAGAWGHDGDHAYVPGTYVYETPGVLHRFVNGPQVSEALFISLGGLEFVDPGTGEVQSALTPRSMIETYMAGCETTGAPRPKILR